ncbi:MAG: nitroreductase family protein [Pseudomonadales bacterium]
MDLFEAMSTQRAVRKLRPDPIPDAVLERVLNAATFAPSGGNHQQWRIVLVRDPTTKQALQDLYLPRWQGYVPGYEEHMKSMPEAERDKSARALAAGTYLAEHLHEAPAIAVFCFNPGIMTITDSEQPRPSVVGGGSVYPAVQNLLLAARAEGLGCVLTTLLCMDEPAVRELLALPEAWYTCAHVPLGYPVGKGHGPISRRGLGQMVFQDRWGEALNKAD